MISANFDYLTQVLTDLVKINSINPDLSSEGVGEEEIAVHLQKCLQDLGMDVSLHELAPRRYNVVGIRKGTGGGKSLMWNAHMDTVGSNGMSSPFSAEIRDGKLYGRGSQDMKGSIAAMLTAVKALNDAGIQLAGDLIIAGVGDEEYASLGTQDLLRRHTADAAIVTEPTELKLCLAHRGFILYEVETIGRAAHGSRYKDGIDAIAHMGRFIVQMEALGSELISRPPHLLVGPPSLHASIIHGGSEASTYPAYCRLEVERRTCPGEIEEQVTREFQNLIDRLKNDDPKFNAHLTPYLGRPAFEIHPDSEIVRAVSKAAQTHLNQPVSIGGASFWTDAALLSEAGIPSVLIGPTGQGLHSAEEWVDLQSCLDLAKILTLSAVNFCSSH